MTKKRIISLNLSILLFLSMILSPFGNLILPSVITANAAADNGSRAIISDVKINNYADVSGITIEFIKNEKKDRYNNTIAYDKTTITLSSGTTIKKVTTKNGNEVGVAYNASSSCASGETHAVPLNGQTGYFSYSLVSTSSTESDGQRTTTYKYQGYFKNDGDKGSNGWQSVDIKWQEKKTEPLEGSLRIEKKWVAKTSNNGQDNIKALVQHYSKAYNKNTKYKFRVFTSKTGGNEIATIANSGITITDYGKKNGYSKKNNNTIKLTSSSSKTVYIQEEDLKVNGWATNTGRQAYTIKPGQTTTVNSTSIGNINVNVPVIMNIKSYKVDNNNNRIKVKGATFNLYYSQTLTTSQMKKKIPVEIKNGGREAIATNKDTTNIVLMATGTTDSTGQVNWKTSEWAKVSGWDYIKYKYNFRGPVGYYVIVETKAPTNYKITNNNKYIKTYDFMSESYATKAYSSEDSFMYTSNSQNQNPNNSNWNLINPNAKSLKIRKSYTNTNMITMFPNIYKKSGAKYNIYYGGTSDDKVVATADINNDGDGVITLKNYGKNLGLTVSSDNKLISNISETMLTNWYVKEIRSASGFNLKSSISKKLSLSNNLVTTFNANSTDVLENDALTGSIHLTKYLSSSGINNSALNSGKLENASLNLYYCPIDQNTIKTESTKYTYKDIKKYLSNNLKIGSETTYTTNNKKYKTRKITTPDNINDIYFIGKFKVKNKKIIIDTINKPYINGKNISPSKVTDSTNGHQYFSNLPLGSYCLIEERTPDYSGQSIIDFSETDHNIVVLNNANGKVTTVSENYFSLNKNNNTFDIKFKIEESDSPLVQLKINKKSTKPGLNLSVKGAKFDVYYNETTNPNITFNGFDKMTAKYTKNNGTKVATFTIDDNGVGKISDIYNNNFSKNNTNTILYGKDGYYVIVESKLPENGVFGWNLDDHNIPIIYRTGKLSTGSKKSYTLNAEDPPVSDPVKMTITKTVNNNQIPNMTEADLKAIRPLENTQFTLNYYLNARNLSDIANKDPDLTIVYKTILVGNKYVIDISEPIFMLSYNGNLNNYLDHNVLEFPVGIYTIKETQASYGYSTANNTWKYNNTTYTGTNDYGLVFKVKNEYNNGTAEAFTYVYNNGQLSDTPIYNDSTSTSIDFDKPNNFDKLGSFRFNKKFNDDGKLRSANNVKFNLYAIKPGRTADIEYCIEKCILFKTDKIYSNPIDLINTQYQSEVKNTLYNYDSPIEIITNSNGNSMIYNNKSKKYINSEDINLPVGDYLLVETRCEANRGYAIHEPVVISITKDTCNEDYWSDNPIINIKPRLITTEYDANTSIYDVEGSSKLLTTKNHMSNSTGTMKIVDEVEYEYLSANTKYTLKAFMMYVDSSDNKVKPVVINGISTPIQKSKVFTTGNATNNIYNTVDGSVKVEFGNLTSDDVIKATNSNKFIIYEYLFKDANESYFYPSQIYKLINNDTSENSIKNAVIINNKFVGHYDAEDINQTGYFPQISTEAIGTVNNGNYKVTRILKETIENDDDDDESDEVNYLEYIKFHDTLSYSGLTPNESYTIELKVRDYNNPSKILYKNIYDFIPKKSTGTYQIKNITVNVDDDINKVFVTENIYYNNVLIASHENLTKEQKNAQSVALARISTNLTSNSQLNDPIADSENRPVNYVRTAIIPEDGRVSLTDTITYKNFIDDNVTYDITCEYRYADGPKVGKVVVDNNNNILRKIEENVKLSGSGTHSITIDNIDLSNFKRKNLKIVAYEIIRFHGTDRVIAKENDRTNAFQSLLFLGTTFKFSKVDNFGNSIRGAKLAIKSVTINTETNKEILENYVTWTTGDNYSVIYNDDPNDPRNSSINNPIETIPFEISLPDGTYYLVEESSPMRYTKAEPIKFKIETINNETKMYIIDTNTANSANVLSKTITMIDNNLTRLPTAGGEGTTVYIVFGMLLMSCSVLYIYKKKRKV